MRKHGGNKMIFEGNFWAELILAVGLAWFLYWIGKALWSKLGGKD